MEILPISILKCQYLHKILCLPQDLSNSRQMEMLPQYQRELLSLNQALVLETQAESKAGRRLESLLLTVIVAITIMLPLVETYTKTFK